MTQKKRFGMFGVLGAALILTVLGACNGLIPEDPGSGVSIVTLNGGKVDGGGTITLDLSLPTSLTAPGRAAADSRGIIQFTSPKEYVTYYEVFFYQRVAVAGQTPPMGIVAQGSAVRGESRLVISVPPNEAAPAGNLYEILVLAGTHANKDGITGEKILLASGYMQNAVVRSGFKNVFTVKMFQVNARVDVWGIPKGSGSIAAIPAITSYTWSTITPTPLSMVTSGETGLNYVQLAKQVLPYKQAATPISNPWSTNVAASASQRLTIGVILTNLDPLILASGTAAPGTNSIFTLTGHEARIVTLSNTAFPMGPITFKYDGVTAPAAPAAGPPIPNGNWAAVGGGAPATGVATYNSIGVTAFPNITARPVVATDNTDITSTAKEIPFQYALAAWVVDTSPQNIKETKIPATDAAGVFYFNYKYRPFGDTSGADSVWNIRNRLLWDAGKYYGGGVVLLFGNAGTDWVEVIPTYP